MGRVKIDKTKKVQASSLYGELKLPPTTVDRKNFHDAVKLCHQIGKTSFNPYDKYVHIKGDKHKDSDNAFVISACNGTCEVEITVPLRYGLEIAGDLYGDQVCSFTKPDKKNPVLEISKENKILNIQAGGFQRRYDLLETDESVSTIDLSGELSEKSQWRQQTLLKHLTWVLEAVSSDESRANICNVYFDENSLVGTDGHRLHRVEFDSNGMFGFLLPKKSALFLRSLCKNEDGYVEVTHVENETNKMIFGYEGWEMKSKLDHGTFPDYKQVFDFEKNDFAYKATLDSIDLKKALKEIIAQKVTNIYVVLNDQEIILQNDKDGSEFAFKVDVDVKNYRPSEITSIGLNAKYMLDAVKDQTSSGELTIELEDNESPAAFSLGVRKAIIMPVRL